MKWWLMGWVMVVAGAALAAKVEPPKPGPGIFFVATNGNDTWSGKLAAPNRRGTDGPLAMPAAGVGQEIKQNPPTPAAGSLLIRR